MLKNPLHWEKNRSRTPLQNVGRWAAVVLLFVSLSFGIVMLISAPVRAAVERWVVEWYQTHIVYRYYGESEGALPRYELTGLSEAFTELQRTESPDFTNVVYGNNSGELIGFTYTDIKEGGTTVIVPNDDDILEVMIGKTPGTLFVPQDPDSMKTLTWIDEKERIQFTIVANLDESDMIGLAESLRKKKRW